MHSGTAPCVLDVLLVFSICFGQAVPISIYSTGLGLELIKEDGAGAVLWPMSVCGCFL